MSSRKRWWISLARVPPTSPLVFEIVAIPLSLRLSAMVCRSAILENSHSVRLPLFRRHLVFRKIVCCPAEPKMPPRSEEHTSELESLMRISYAVFCLKKKTNKHNKQH